MFSLFILDVWFFYIYVYWMSGERKKMQLDFEFITLLIDGAFSDKAQYHFGL